MSPGHNPTTRDEKLAVWGEGPWVDEPNRVEFRAHGFACLLNRNLMGVWCGYVAMPPGHPWYGKHYDAVPADVHGGLTYGDECQGDICHVAEPGEPDNAWWLGFDCAHWDDFMPQSRFIERVLSERDPEWGQRLAEAKERPRNLFFRGEYRDESYVRAETERLAEQARKAASFWSRCLVALRRAWGWVSGKSS